MLHTWLTFWKKKMPMPVLRLQRKRCEPIGPIGSHLRRQSKAFSAAEWRHFKCRFVSDYCASVRMRFLSIAVRNAAHWQGHHRPASVRNAFTHGAVRSNTALHLTPPVIVLCWVGWLCRSGVAGERNRWAAGRKLHSCISWCFIAP